MVKKLFKHEYHFYLRIMGIVYGILLTMSVATRLIMVFESDTDAYEIISSLTLITYFISVLAAFGFAFVLSIVRFYKNMFTCEGYLTHTLPVTASQHIMVKSITALSFSLLSAVMVICSVMIALPSEILTELFAEFSLIGQSIYELGGDNLVLNLTLVGVEYLLLILLAAFSSILFYYTCISIGQLSKKNRILAAVGAYFGFYILGQIFTTIATINLAVFATSAFFYDMIMWAEANPFTAIHLLMWGIIVLTGLGAAVEFLAVRWIITKKLNLE